MGNFALHVLALVAIYSILAYSLNLVTGFGGLLTFCQASLYGVGAYAYALLRVGSPAPPFARDLVFSASVSFAVALAGAAAAGAVAALLIGVIALRFRGDLFVLATLGFQVIVVDILLNATSLTRGPFGIYGIRRPDLFGWQVQAPAQYAGLFLIISSLVLLLMMATYRSRFGLRLKALRDNERAAESLGISAFRQHLTALILFGACSGLAGALFASYVTYIDPASFQLGLSLFIVSSLLLGGSGNLRGPLIGVLVMVVMPELLRFVGLPEAIAANLREILYGVALILLMHRRPQGIAGSFRVT
jgi:branched-chain amino acid transport system permease protein